MHNKAFTLVEVMLIGIFLFALVATALLLLGKESPSQASVFFKPAHPYQVEIVEK